MPLITWDSRLATGHPKIDEQHQALIDALNRLHAAMKQGRGKDELGSILTFLADYTASHFKMEEDLMARSGYPQQAHHKEIHEDLLKEVSDLIQKFKAGTTTLTLPVMDFLENWLTTHILGEDFRLAEYLRKH